MPSLELQLESSVTFLVANNAAQVLQARQLCHDVYLRAGYIASAYPSRIIPDLYSAGNTYIIALDSSKNVVGTLRLSVLHPCRTFSTWNGRLYAKYAGLIAAARNRPSFEIGALAVCRDTARLKISWGLYNLAYRWALAAGKEYGIISMDHRALRALEMVGWQVIQIGEPMHYFGSLTVPGIIPINDQPAFAAAKA